VEGLAVFFDNHRKFQTETPLMLLSFHSRCGHR
jgi:hypothetical protein